MSCFTTPLPQPQLLSGKIFQDPVSLINTSRCRRIYFVISILCSQCSFFFFIHAMQQCKVLCGISQQLRTYRNLKFKGLLNSSQHCVLLNDHMIIEIIIRTLHSLNTPQSLFILFALLCQKEGKNCFVGAQRCVSCVKTVSLCVGLLVCLCDKENNTPLLVSVQTAFSSRQQTVCVCVSIIQRKCVITVELTYSCSAHGYVDTQTQKKERQRGKKKCINPKSYTKACIEKAETRACSM